MGSRKRKLLELYSCHGAIPMKYRTMRVMSLVIAFHVLVSGTMYGQDSVTVDFFPGKRIFPRLTADALEHTLSLSKVTENRDWMGTIGASVPLVQIAGGSYSVQAGLAVTTFNGLIKPPGHLT